MKLLFQQRFFSWFDSYDIYDEDGNTVYVVKGQLSWGHCLKVFDASGQELGTVKEKILTWLPKFELYEGSSYVGCIGKELSFCHLVVVVGIELVDDAGYLCTDFDFRHRLYRSGSSYRI